jgi:hydroxyacylglutathione hydrolase
VAFAAPGGFNTGLSNRPRANAREMLEVIPVPAFADNYLWLVRGLADAGRAAVVDPGDARPVMQALSAHGLTLDTILVTHHHADHVGGVASLAEATGATVFGPAGETLPLVHRRLRGGGRIELARLGLAFDVLDVPGHTAGHIAYHGHGALFCGDTLFSGGCGRLFEGTPAQMLDSLDTLAALPDATRVYCAHEYTLSNLRFALEVERDNRDLADYANEARLRRERAEPTLPSTIGLEKRINPFLRSRAATVRASAEAHAGAALDSPVAVFAEIRRWKDGFR